MAAPVDLLLVCSSPLYRYARALSGDSVEAEELVQETYKRALAARRSPAATADEMRAWLFTILRNIWYNEVRRRHHDVRSDPGYESTRAAADSPESLLDRKLLRSEVRSAIDSLPEVFREVIVLRDMEDLSYAEIAAILKCPSGTVMSRLARGRALLREMLAQFAPITEPEAARHGNGKPAGEPAAGRSACPTRRNG